jgi:hypothetical protein
MRGDISVTQSARAMPNIGRSDDRRIGTFAFQTERSEATCIATVSATGTKNEIVTRMAKVFMAGSGLRGDVLDEL